MAGFFSTIARLQSRDLFGLFARGDQDGARFDALFRPVEGPNDLARILDQLLRGKAKHRNFVLDRRGLSERRPRPRPRQVRGAPAYGFERRGMRCSAPTARERASKAKA